MLDRGATDGGADGAWRVRLGAAMSSVGVLIEAVDHDFAALAAEVRVVVESLVRWQGRSPGALGRPVVVA